MNPLASHNWWRFHRDLCLLFSPHFDNTFPAAAAYSGWTLVPCFLELVPCYPGPSGSALAFESSSAATAYDRALHAPKFPATDTVIFTIRHGHSSCWRVFAI